MATGPSSGSTPTRGTGSSFSPRARKAEVVALRAAGVDPCAAEPEHSTAFAAEAGKRDG